MSNPYRCVSIAVVMLSLAFFPGCNNSVKKGCVVSGKLLLNGSPLKVEGRENGTGAVMIKFIPTFANGEEEERHVNKDGSYELDGAGRGIAPGKYKIAVRQWEPIEVNDKLKGAFSPEKTTITFDVPSQSKATFNIDLEKHRR